MKIPPTLDFDERGSVEVILSALEAHLESVEVPVVETNEGFVPLPYPTFNYSSAQTKFLDLES
ncbi:hypothetical protein EST38_g4880 [Candolleomyces aberdarensis]|uniref:Uncharacterized protein n=1 Tax=Candolleomyces aberdarensis TaxID=2316362 RepID=A0A4Q2DQ52_9AGAR|nr:hypothetical protein EST38_g4880 [Candolleomyces aberdarensis]